MSRTLPLVHKTPSQPLQGSGLAEAFQLLSTSLPFLKLDLNARRSSASVWSAGWATVAHRQSSRSAVPEWRGLCTTITHFEG